MSTLPKKRGETGPYRLAVPMSDETYAQVAEWARRCQCTRTEAARVLLEWAAVQALRQAKK